MLKARHGRLLVTILALALLAALARWLEDSPTPHNPSSADRQSETSVAGCSAAHCVGRMP
jgi:hypothetical protein